MFIAFRRFYPHPVGMRGLRHHIWFSSFDTALTAHHITAFRAPSTSLVPEFVRGIYVLRSIRSCPTEGEDRRNKPGDRRLRGSALIFRYRIFWAGQAGLVPGFPGNRHRLASCHVDRRTRSGRDDRMKLVSGFKP